MARADRTLHQFPVRSKRAATAACARGAATASRSSDPARRGRQLRRREGSRGSYPRLLGPTIGGYLIAHSGSAPVNQRSTAPRVRPMHNLRRFHQSRQKSLNRSAPTPCTIILARHLETFPDMPLPPLRGPGRGARQGSLGASFGEPTTVRAGAAAPDVVLIWPRAICLNRLDFLRRRDVLMVIRPHQRRHEVASRYLFAGLK
jgi:hypothetical protein